MIPRFSITGLMLFTLGVAGGVSASLAVHPVSAKLFRSNPLVALSFSRATAALTCALLIWVAVGLLYQAWDIWNDLRAKRLMSVETRNALWFAAAWRSCVALLLPLTYLFEYWGSSVGHAKGDATSLALFLYPAHFEFVRWLSLLIAIGVGGGYREGKAVSAKFSRWIDGVALLAGICLTLVIVFESGVLFRLVSIAINGVEAAHPLKWKRVPLGRDFIDKEAAWFKLSQIQLACALSAVATVGVLSRTSLQSARRKCLLVCLTVTLAMASLAIQVWFRLFALPQLSPEFAEVLPVIPPLPNVLIGFSAILCIAARASYSPSESVPATWRAHPMRYLHERRPVLAVACLVALSHITHAAWQLYDVRNAFSWLGNAPFFSIVNDFLVSPENYWPLAMLLLAGQRLVTASRDRESPYITCGLTFKRLIANGLLFGLVGVAVVCAAGTWSIAAWIPLGWAW